MKNEPRTYVVRMRRRYDNRIRYLRKDRNFGVGLMFATQYDLDEAMLMVISLREDGFESSLISLDEERSNINDELHEARKALFEANARYNAIKPLSGRS